MEEFKIVKDGNKNVLEVSKTNKILVDKEKLLKIKEALESNLANVNDKLNAIETADAITKDEAII